MGVGSCTQRASTARKLDPQGQTPSGSFPFDRPRSAPPSRGGAPSSPPRAAPSRPRLQRQDAVEVQLEEVAVGTGGGTRGQYACFPKSFLPCRAPGEPWPPEFAVYQNVRTRPWTQVFTGASGCPSTIRARGPRCSFRDVTESTAAGLRPRRRYAPGGRPLWGNAARDRKLAHIYKYTPRLSSPRHVAWRCEEDRGRCNVDTDFRGTGGVGHAAEKTGRVVRGDGEGSGGDAFCPGFPGRSCPGRRRADGPPRRSCTTS